MLARTAVPPCARSHRRRGTAPSSRSTRPAGITRCSPWAFCLLPQQAFNAAAVVHHMKKLHMNGHAAAESTLPVIQVSEASRPNTPTVGTQPAAPNKDKDASLPLVPTESCPNRPTQLEQDTGMREGKLQSHSDNGPLPTGSSLVLPDNHSPPTRTSCGCSPACMGHEKTKTSFCSETVLLKKSAKSQ